MESAQLPMMRRNIADESKNEVTTQPSSTEFKPRSDSMFGKATLMDEIKNGAKNEVTIATIKTILWDVVIFFIVFALA